MQGVDRARRFLRENGRGVATAGVAVIGGATVLSGLLYLVQRQLREGDVLSVRLVHDIEPETRQLVESYLPVLEDLSDRGMDVNMRLFKRSSSE